MTVTINGTTGYSGPVGTIGDLTTTGNTTLGDASGDTLTLNGNTASIPNGLNFTNGNVGIGATPSAWGGSYKVLQLTGGNIGAFSTTAITTFQNAYDSGVGSYVYLTTAAASRYTQSQGLHQWFNAPSGTAGAAITFTQAMTLDASGNFMVGATSANGRARFVGAASADCILNLETSTNNYASGVALTALNDNGAIYNYIISKTNGGTEHWKIGGVGASSALAFSTAGSERARIDSSGNLLVGTTSLASSFSGFAQIEASGSTGGVLINSATNNIGRLIFTNNNTSGSEGLIRYDGSNNSMQFWTAAVERARIDSSGNFLVNGTAVGASDSGAPQISLASAVTSAQWTSRIVSRNTGNSTASFLGNYKNVTSVAGVFAHNAALSAWTTLYVNTIDGTSANGGNVVISDNLMVGTATTAQTLSTNHYFTLRNTSGTPWGVGPTSSYGNFYVTNGGVGVYLSNGGTSWTSYSDERVKDIIEPITDAASKVSTLRAVIGKYKTDQDGVRRPFLIAQDVQAVLPEAVNVQGEDDDTLGLQYTDVIPLLVAAIKELKAEFDAYKQTHP